MANIINFSSAFIRTCNLTLDEGTKKIRINVSTGWTKEVRDKMDWNEPERPKNFKGRLVDEAASDISLDGELLGQTMTLTPNDAELRKSAFSIEIGKVSAFQLVTVKDENSRRKELRFQVMTTARGAAGAIEAFTDRVGQGKATLKISYVQQSEMDLAAAEDEPRATEEQRLAVIEGD